MQKFKSYELKIALLITSGFVIKRAYDSLKYKILQLETRVTKLEYPIHSSKRRELFRQGFERILKAKTKDLKNIDKSFNHPPVQIKTR